MTEEEKLIALKAIVSAEVRKKYPKIYMTGEYVKSPPSFPCVSLIETDNQVYRNTRDSVPRFS